ncbi:hypothetical protein LX64_03304 [Chitinophaga skermanii]|uniref:Xaa-Pro dipeptidyl-peptidase-like domain-containing protein n=1 Tax=Chitinophaga skermanii TaxID=331697 RepID=A0A327QE61_9BACT|nr:alpha/beta fold hydrolase [Chitinophaga skermanii]RAJ02295.1 hypothetical protein LX64_03304 [Chitinophaga skermanii]
MTYLKRFTSFLLCGSLLVMLTISASAQIKDISGDWFGTLDVGAGKLRLQLHTEKEGTGYKGKLISIDQGNATLQADTLTYNESTGELRFVLNKLQVVYTGVWDSNKSAFSGDFYQGKNMKLVLKKENAASFTAKKIRPQTPQQPYPYDSEDVTFPNETDHITLAGTLTKPKSGGPFPVVVLITGSGPQNRNEELMGHEPFLIWADYLTKQGIAVLRYDDRGVGKSTGNYAKSGIPDFFRDAQAAVNYLATRSDIDPKKIGLMGHSEGGVVAPMVAAEDKRVAFVVSLAGVGINGVELMAKQNYLVWKSNGKTEAEALEREKLMRELFIIANATPNKNELGKKAKTVLEQLYATSLSEEEKKKVTPEMFNLQTAMSVSSPSIAAILNIQPEKYLPYIKCPVLAVNGEKDIQVQADENLQGFDTQIKKGGNKQITTKKFPGLNHLFQHCTTCTVAEYAEIDETVAPAVLQYVGAWMQTQVRKK